MTQQLRYQIQFYGYWHVGSGLSASTYADAVVLKDPDDFPIIPGKTLKGLLSDAANAINKVQPAFISAAFIRDVFGESGDRTNKDEQDTPYSPSTCFFSNATLSEQLRAQLPKAMLSGHSEPVNLVNTLYEVLSSTQIENGMAKDGSLRQLEVCVPLPLYASIEGDCIDNYVAEIDYCFGWIKRMGLNRNRGLGRCRFTRITE